jgi:hypothetical protein
MEQLKYMFKLIGTGRRHKEGGENKSGKSWSSKDDCDQIAAYVGKVKKVFRSER